ncbi:uncharacterized protein LOC101739572 isoform X1 [Bombyx mori]
MTNTRNVTNITVSSEDRAKFNRNKSKDSLELFEKTIMDLLYGEKWKERAEGYSFQKKEVGSDGQVHHDALLQYPSGQVRRSELFFNRSAVHLPPSDFTPAGQNLLKITNDYMQTAVNAFAIFVYGNVNDIYRLPPDYVLRSARTIAMLQIPLEKLVATWYVVKQDRPTSTISYRVLELYRPLFKHLSGREMAKLNLSDERIVYYIGTHLDLNRHQVGVIANRYIELNPNWTKPKYLNLMNNLLCGIALPLMRNIQETTYLQLSSQVFSHIRACDPLQKRFYLGKMTRSQVYGKSFSWGARDVSHLGLLLMELDGTDFSAIKPKAMSGFTPHVLQEMPVSTLKHITKAQTRYLSHKCQILLAKKLKMYEEDQLFTFSSASFIAIPIYIILILIL